LECLEDRLAPAFTMTVGTAQPTANVSMTVNGTTTTFAATGTGAFLNTADLTTALNGGDVVVNSGSAGTEAGNITIANAITSPTTAAHAVSFNSGTGTDLVGDIDVNADISAAPGGALPLNVQATGTLNLNGNLNAGSGTVELQGTNGGVAQTSGHIVTTTGILAVSVAAHVGALGAPLHTAAGTFGVFSGGRGVFVANASAALTVGFVDPSRGLNVGVSATGPVSLTTSGNLTVSQPVTATGAAATLTGAGALTVNAAVTGNSAAVDGGGGADTFTVTATGATPLALDGKGGGDTYTVDVGSLLGKVRVAPSASGGTNTVVVHGPPTAAAFTVTATAVTFGTQEVDYGGVERLQVIGGNVSSTSFSTGNQFLVRSTVPGMTTTVDTGTGPGNVYVSSAVGKSGTLGSVVGLLNVTASAGSFLTVSAAGALGADTMTVTSTAVRGSNFTVNYQAASGSLLGVNVATGTGADHVNVQSTAAGAVTGVLNFGGADTVDVGSDSANNRGDLSGAQGKLYVLVSGGSDELIASEGGSATADTVTVTDGELSSSVGQGFSIAYMPGYATGQGTFTGVNFAVGTGNNTVNVEGALAGVLTRVFTAGSAGTVNVGVGPNSAYSLTVTAMLPAGVTSAVTLNVADLSGKATVHNTPSGANSGKVQVLYADGATSTITYSDIGQVQTTPTAT
jgi:hypothetical protein